MKENNDYSKISFVLEKLSYAEFDFNDFNRIEDSMQKIKNMKLFIEIIERNSIQVLVYDRIKNYFPKIFNSIIKICNWNYQFAKYESRFLIQNTFIFNIAKESSKLGIKIVFLKGFCFSQCLYREKFYKKMNDIDLLIEERDIHEFENILKNNKFSCLFNNLFSKKSNTSKTHHLPPYISEDKSCVITVHWQLSRNFQKNNVINFIWDDIVPIPNFQNCYRMSWECNVLHLCIHLSLYKAGFKELADIFNIIKFCSPLDTKKFKKLIIEISAYEKIYRAFVLTSKFFPELNQIQFFLEITNFCYNFIPKKLILQLEKRTRSLKFLLISRTTYITKLEKSFLLFKLSKSYNNKFKIWLKMWKILFMIPDSEQKCISGYIGNNIFVKYYYKFVTPIKIIRALCSEHGIKNIFFFTISNAFIIVSGLLKLSFFSFEKEQYDINLINLYKEME
ncbi:nucleotidyltransferase family protein [Pigmentibacter ruber]|uniref:nucleotidyltransferase family protein n=1 Tax=Pigmentibacter ruber TaxID=2683196 RepID=UPI00131CEC5C|nr:nucleotidyltransferase family protein [Pigmentibacter ruber]